jgi:Tetracyclin repressor-like, C-terminal domain
VDQPEGRAALTASQMVGLAFCRRVLRVPQLASAAPEDLGPDIGNTIQRYLTAPLPAAGDHSGDRG